MSEELKAELRERRRRAIQAARYEHEHGEPVWRNLCQKFTRSMLGAPGGAPSARVAWRELPASRRRDVGNRMPPAGVPVYFQMDTPYWHAALSAGRGFIWSTDIIRRGQVDKVSITYLERRWNATYVGWATEINGVRVW